MAVPAAAADQYTPYGGCGPPGLQSHRPSSGPAPPLHWGSPRSGTPARP